MAGRQGSRTWFFPDGDIPPAGDPPQGHESLIMLNPGDTDAEVVLTVYFEDREPEVLVPQVVGARRVRCIRTNEPIGGFQIPFGQYALKLESSVPDRLPDRPHGRPAAQSRLLHRDGPSRRVGHR